MPHPQDPALIAIRAFQIWDREGRPDGHERQHWKQAERQLNGELHNEAPDATGDEDPDSYLSSSDSERAIAERGDSQQLGATKPVD